MGFFDFMRSGNKIKVEETAEPQSMGSVEVNLVREKVMEYISEQMEKEREKTKELYVKIKDDFRQIKKLNNELWEKKFKSGERMDVPINMIKDNYAKKTLSLMNNAPEINTFDYSDINTFCSSTDRILKEMRNLPAKQVVLLSNYFKGQTSKIIKTLKSIEDRKKEMEELLQGKALFIDGEINTRNDKIFQLIKRVKDLESQEKTLTEKIENKKNEVTEKEKEINDFLKGKEFSDYENLGTEASDFEKERMKIEADIRDEISGVKRPLKKLEHNLRTNRSITKDKLLLCSKISKSPLKVLLENGDSVLKEALVKLREINMKDDEKIHVEELVTKINNGYISKLIDKYKWTEVQIADRKEEEGKSDILERKATKQRELENKKKEVTEFEKDKEKIVINKNETSETVTEEIKKLEELVLREINLKVEITF